MCTAVSACKLAGTIQIRLIQLCKSEMRQDEQGSMRQRDNRKAKRTAADPGDLVEPKAYKAGSLSISPFFEGFISHVPAHVKCPGKCRQNGKSISQPAQVVAGHQHAGVLDINPDTMQPHRLARQRPRVAFDLDVLAAAGEEPGHEYVRPVRRGLLAAADVHHEGRAAVAVFPTVIEMKHPSRPCILSLRPVDSLAVRHRDSSAGRTAFGYAQLQNAGNILAKGKARLVLLRLPEFGRCIHLHVSGYVCLLYTSPSPRDQRGSRMPSSA